MSMDFTHALDEIAAHAQGAVRPVDVDGLRARVRRRRTQGIVVRSVGGLAAVGVVASTLTFLGGDPATAPARVPVATMSTSPSPTPSPTPTADPTPVAGWVPGGTPCGSTFALEVVDDPGLEVQGSVVIGTLDRDTAAFGSDPTGSTVFLDVRTTAHVPGQPAGDGLARLTTMLVDDSGTVAFWSDPAREIPQFESADGRSASMYGMYDALDCRTGRPLVGTYRAFAHDEGGPETAELGPVTFGPDGTRPLEPLVDQLPVCGRPVPDVKPDLTVALDPGVVLDGVDPAGLHAAVTVTGVGPGRLHGRVPQALRAVLVDEQGIVVTQAFDPLSGRHDSGATFDVGAGDSFAAEVYQWFTPCTVTNDAGSAGPGSYGLYVYDVVLADDGSGVPATRTAVGGPFPVTLR